MLRGFLFFLFSSFFFGAGSVSAEEKNHPLAIEKSPLLKRTFPVKHASPIEVYADEMTDLKKKHRIVARGRVRIKYRNRFILADKVIINTETGYGIATGNVEYVDEHDVIRSREARFNIKKKEGIIYDVDAFVDGQYHISGKEMEKYGDKRFRATDATLTTCDGPLPFWSICATSIDGEKDGMLEMKGARFQIKGIPILYLPYWYASIESKRKSGFLMPEYQYSTTDGSVFKGKYFWAISESQDATIALSFLTKKGLKPEGEYRYVLDEKSRGSIRGLYLKEKDTKRTFWELRYNHVQEFGDNWRVFGSGFMQDKTNSYTKEFSQTIQEQSLRTSVATANISKEWENAAFLTNIKYEQSLQLNADQTISTLPDIQLYGYRRYLGDTPFFVGLDLSYRYMINKQNLLKDTSGRLDIRPTIGFHKNFFPWLKLSASGTYLSSLYTQTRLRNNVIDKTGVTRNLPLLHVKLEGPRFSKVYGDSLKHYWEPFLEYNYIPNSNKPDRKKIAIFDATDAISNMNKLTWGVKNSLIAFTGEGESIKPVKAVSFLLQQSYKFDNTPKLEVSPFSNLYSDNSTNGIDTFVVPDLTAGRFSNIYAKIDALLFNGQYHLIADGELNPYTLAGDKYNISLQRVVDGNTLTLAKRYNRRYNDYWSIDLYQRLNSIWAFRYQNGYSARDKQILYHMAGVDYSESCCWSVSLAYIRKSTVINKKVTNDNRITFLINFVGLGSVGRKN